MGRRRVACPAGHRDARRDRDRRQRARAGAAGPEPVFGTDIAPGDKIVLLPSSGLHANGASLARRVSVASCPAGCSPSFRAAGTWATRCSTRP